MHQVKNDQPIALIKAHDYAGVLTQDGDKLTLTLANADQGKSAILKQTLQAAATALKIQATTLQKLATALKQATHGAAQIPEPHQPKTPSYTLTTHYRYGSADSTYFDTLLPILMGFIVFFFVFLISGIALLRERTTGTLYRLLATTGLVDFNLC
ncbi:ABC-2 family transporter protein [Lacticaseibacillus paracasei]|nr:ABC-2 family transporter protein [Lacticaseibacillus paracasei]